MSGILVINPDCSLACSAGISMETLLEPAAEGAALVVAGRELAAMGVQTVVLGCTGDGAPSDGGGGRASVPVFEPCQPATVLAFSTAVGWNAAAG